jgi:hypothetical protein
MYPFRRAGRIASDERAARLNSSNVQRELVRVRASGHVWLGRIQLPVACRFAGTQSACGRATKVDGKRNTVVRIAVNFTPIQLRQTLG